MTGETRGLVIIGVEYVGLVLLVVIEQYFLWRRERANAELLRTIRRYLRQNIPPWDGEAI